MGERAQKAAPWAGVIAAVPAIALALQGYLEARAAQRGTDRAEERTEERDDKGWRFTRYVLERQQDEIEMLYHRVEDLESALEDLTEPAPLIKRIERKLAKPAPPAMPQDYDMVQKHADELPPEF
jgi:hypothetical protein